MAKHKSGAIKEALYKSVVFKVAINKSCAIKEALYKSGAIIEMFC